jgi:hypothetical protein
MATNIWRMKEDVKDVEPAAPKSHHEAHGFGLAGGRNGMAEAGDLRASRLFLNPVLSQQVGGGGSGLTWTPWGDGGPRRAKGIIWGCLSIHVSAFLRAYLVRMEVSRP